MTNVTEDEAKALVLKWYADRGKSINDPPTEESEVRRRVRGWEEIVKESPKAFIWKWQHVYTSDVTIRRWELLTWAERWRVCRWVSDLHAAMEALERLDYDHRHRANLQLDKHRDRKEYGECFDNLNRPNEMEDAQYVWDAIESTRQ